MTSGKPYRGCGWAIYFKILQAYGQSIILRLRNVKGNVGSKDPDTLLISWETEGNKIGFF
jgi:hypothetical protein